MGKAVVLIGLVAAALGSTLAQAAPAISVKSTSFPVSGRSGVAILQDLERRGPKHGFMSRAIAQTRYQMNSEAEWVYSDGWCRVTKPQVKLDITYVYPKLVGPIPPALAARWKVFMAGVVRHEETHGRMAREMAHAAERALGQLRVRDGRACRRFGGEMKRVVNEVVDRYERRQVRFDEVEHKPGGAIAALIGRLAK